MKSTLLIVVALTAIGGAFFLLKNSDERTEVVDMTGKSEISIVLSDGGYEPREVKIDKGTKITFSTTRNNQYWPASSLHPTHNIYSEFDPKQPLAADEEWSFVFENEGEWGFHDHIRSYFTGVIYVGEQ